MALLHWLRLRIHRCSAPIQAATRAFKQASPDLHAPWHHAWQVQAPHFSQRSKKLQVQQAMRAAAGRPHFANSLRCPTRQLTKSMSMKPPRAVPCQCSMQRQAHAEHTALADDDVHEMLAAKKAVMTAADTPWRSGQLCQCSYRVPSQCVLMEAAATRVHAVYGRPKMMCARPLRPWRRPRDCLRLAMPSRRHRHPHRVNCCLRAPSRERSARATKV